MGTRMIHTDRRAVIHLCQTQQRRARTIRSTLAIYSLLVVLAVTVLLATLWSAT